MSRQDAALGADKARGLQISRLVIASRALGERRHEVQDAWSDLGFNYVAWKLASEESQGRQELLRGTC